MEHLNEFYVSFLSDVVRQKGYRVPDSLTETPHSAVYYNTSMENFRKSKVRNKLCETVGDRKWNGNPIFHFENVAVHRFYFYCFHLYSCVSAIQSRKHEAA